MARFVLSPEARDDLREIRNYVARDDVDAAHRVLRDLRDAMEKLATMPQMGHVREDLADEPLRFWPVYTYLIVYRPNRQPLQVVRVLSGYRNIPELLP